MVKEYTCCCMAGLHLDISDVLGGIYLTQAVPQSVAGWWRYGLPTCYHINAVFYDSPSNNPGHGGNEVGGMNTLTQKRNILDSLVPFQIGH